MRLASAGLKLLVGLLARGRCEEVVVVLGGLAVGRCSSMARVRAASAKRSHWVENSVQDMLLEKVISQCAWNSARCSLAEAGRLASAEESGSGGMASSISGDDGVWDG